MRYTSTRTLQILRRCSRARPQFALLFCLLPFGFLACPGKPASDTNNASPTPAMSPVTNPTASPAAANAPVFDADRAFAHVRRMVEIGPRPAGSKELARTREMIVNELRSYNLQVSVDEFDTRTPVGKRRMANVTAELAGESSDQIIIASHYDTKLVKEFRFVGANDSGSSTGTVMEIARVLALSHQNKKPRFTLRFVFFDGEEAFCENWDDCGTEKEPDNTYGSRRYVAQLIDKGELKRVRALILLDMIGYKNLQIPRESTGTAWLTDIIWTTARETNHAAQFVNESESITDDHIPFLNAGINAVDLIQFGGYGEYWHTAEDTLDKISPQSLKAVGDVVLASLPRIEERLMNKNTR
ncbi:MAG: M28 family peptidase [Pyrinomonadaceae bacterium]|nr:M28 family peptidase [Pyrinomonadaceae bacterium]